jgi:2-oxoglutarate dehydrogenase E1 component
MVRRHIDTLQDVMESLKPEHDLVEPKPEPPPPGAARRMETAVSTERLRGLHQSLLDVPAGFTIHRKIARAMERRRHIMDDSDEPSIEWATAEELAFATILEDGISIRLTGQDVERGTFSQRHCVFHDVQTGRQFVPLQSLPQANAAFEVHNSPLSEIATVGFEFGYNVQAPKLLVLWEAQYGDFINVTQIMIDEFIVSARSKWGQTPSLVLLLPHGYEGQGPDHSTGRLERFLQLAMDTNLRIANCTTAAQYFHLLRRQALLLETDPLPLIVMTPKSLLRHPLVASRPRDFAHGQWQPIIDDHQAQHQPDHVRRLILCSGKMYVDLVTSDVREDNSSIAIIRVEQLFPFPVIELHMALRHYSNLEEVIWLQEEPENMGAWTFAQPRLLDLIESRCPLRYIGRPASASPSEGSMTWHTINQNALIEQAFSFGLNAETDDRVWLKTT